MKPAWALPRKAQVGANSSGPPGGDATSDLGACLLHADALLLHYAPSEEALPVGVDAVSQEIVDRHVVGGARARHRFGQCGEAGARRRRKTHLRAGRLHHGGGYVDDAAEFARLNARQQGADQQGRRQHVRIERAEPGRMVPIGELARRRTGVVVDQDVGLGTGGSLDRPASVLMSATTGLTRAPVARSISAAASLRAASPRALMKTTQPSRASAVAQALPSPLEEARTIALRPLMPRGMAPRDGDR